MQQLTDECKAVLLLGRVSLTDSDKTQLMSLINKKLDWYLLVNMSFKNKTLPLAWHNIQQLKLRGQVPTNIVELIRFFTIGILEKNTVLFYEFKLIRDVLSRNEIPFSPLKGLILIDWIYNKSNRQMNDIDIMVSRESITQVREQLNDIGYFESEVDTETGEGRKLTREEEITWKMYMYNLPPFVKSIDSAFMDSVQVDFTFNIKFDSTNDPCKTFLDRAVYSESLGCNVLNDNDMCIHLCCHLYKEAKNIVWVERAADFNLIKFSDVREFMLRKKDSLDFESLIRLVIEYDVKEAFYLTFFCLKQIFNDGYEDEVLNRVDIDDESIINTFGQRDLGEAKQYSGGILERLFDYQLSKNVHAESQYSQL